MRGELISGLYNRGIQRLQIMAQKARKNFCWSKYEAQIYRYFKDNYPESQILFDQKLKGRYSEVNRQIDILVKHNVTDNELIGVFDCKHFSQKVNVKVIDSMVGFIDDIGANFGGVISSIDFTEAAKNRAKNAREKIDLRTIPYTSPEEVVSYFKPSLDFRDPRNSMYIAVI